MSPFEGTNFSPDSETSAFRVENYNYVQPFSSFLPGIAGLWGVPAWVYWVTRGQAISGVGVGSRDAQILELYSFNKAVGRVELEGFRTFLRLDGRNVPEPFRRREYTTGASQTLVVAPHEIMIEHTDASWGFDVEVIYHTIPNRRVPGLVRSVTITDRTGRPRRLEWLDGVPRILPYGVDQHSIKVTPRHIEAMIGVDYFDRIPMYRLRQAAVDDAEVVAVTGANFLKTWSIDGDVSTVVDPAAVFEDHFAFDHPLVFERGGADEVRGRQQIERGRTPCGFALWDGELPAHGSVQLFSLIGRADRPDDLDAVASLASHRAWAGVRDENRLIVDEIADQSFTVSSSPLFDGYCRQNQLDNIIRGGMPVSLGASNQSPSTYVFSHQNADLERDYHQFDLSPTYLSAGLGHFRNTLQNRRDDAFFHPNAATENLRIFFGLVQLDGYNPLEVLPLTFRCGDHLALEGWAARVASNDVARERLVDLMTGEFSLGSLAMWMEDASGRSAGENAEVLGEAMEFLVPNEVGSIHAGYWIDHWHYLVDLLDCHLGVFPDRIEELLLERSYTWFDDPDVVVPRVGRYVATPSGMRQLGSVVRDHQKEAMIAERSDARFRARTLDGELLTSSLLEKLVLIAATRLATLDSSGIGVEMEAGKPGWNDSLNGLPGLFGSGLSETIELRRLLRLLDDWLTGLSVDHVTAYEELVDLVLMLSTSSKRRASGGTALEFWQDANAIKETYRDRVRLGVSGTEQSVKIGVLQEFCRLGLAILDRQLLGPGRAEVVGDDGIPHTYFVGQSRPGLMPEEFPRIPVGPFLEGSVHWIKEFPEEARSVYQAVRKSVLYDTSLGMYKLSGPMDGADPELGRAVGAYPPGWLENESIYTHMEYKYLLEVLRSGLIDEFWQDAQKCLMPFLDPATYGRSPLEGSSFIVSSAHPDPTEHGRGYQPRLSGITAEFVSIWLQAVVGTNPFRMKGGAIEFAPQPQLPGWLFTTESTTRSITSSGIRSTVEFPPGSFVFRGTHGSLVRYDNPARIDTFGPGGVKPVQFEVAYSDGSHRTIDAPTLSGHAATSLRSGEVRRLDITLR